MREHRNEKRAFAALLSALLVLNCVPSYAYAADAENWASLEGWLSDINGKLGLIYYDLDSIINDYLNDWYNNIEDIVGYVDGIESQLTTISLNTNSLITSNTSINSTLNNWNKGLGYFFPDFTNLNNTKYRWTNFVDSVLVKLNVITDFAQYDDITGEPIGFLVNDPFNQLIYEKLEDGLSIGDSTVLEDIKSDTGNLRLDLGITNGILSGILAKMVIDEVQEDLIGDFDWPAYSTNINALVSAASGKFPFSSVMGLRTFVMNNPLFGGTGNYAVPLTLDWQFGIGQTQTVIVDPSFMQQAKPYIRFFVYILFVYGLLLTTYKMVRES